MGSSIPAQLRQGDLVAVRLPPGPGWVDLVRELWGAGAALIPLDHRLSEPTASALLAKTRPTVICDGDGWKRKTDGEPAEDGVALVVATSGTGGDPKLVQLDRTAIEAAVAASALALDAGPSDGWFSCLPLAHIGGLLVLFRSMLLGAPVTVHPAFDPATFARDRAAAFTSIVPTMLFRSLAAGVDLSGFRAILVGGGDFSEELRGRAISAGARVVTTYGLTESCGGVVYDGRPFEGTSIRIDPGTGGIELRGPTLMRGYLFDPALSALAFAPDGWLRTGDAGELLSDGSLRVLGRLDELIVTGGEKVWPEEVEAALRDHPKIADIAIGGRPDPEWGQRVVAFVVPKDAVEPPALQELRGWMAEMPRPAAPRELVLVDVIPRTDSGKVRRAELPGE